MFSKIKRIRKEFLIGVCLSLLFIQDIHSENSKPESPQVETNEERENKRYEGASIANTSGYIIPPRTLQTEDDSVLIIYPPGVPGELSKEKEKLPWGELDEKYYYSKELERLREQERKRKEAFQKELDEKREAQGLFKRKKK